MTPDSAAADDRHPASVTGNASVDRERALVAFNRISQRFAVGFDDSEPKAYGDLLRDLMDHAALLIAGGLMSAKEVLDKIEDLQQHIKKGGSAGKSALDLFNGWFNDPVPTETETVQ
jgi:hypothetical protein